jgi:hypothetical protein
VDIRLFAGAFAQRQSGAKQSQKSPWSFGGSKLVVILVVLTEWQFGFSLHISQLLAKAIPVRGAKFKKPAF